MKKAHAISRPDYQVGDEVLGLCGKEFTVTHLWADIPKSKPICRKCVDTALKALTEADEMIQKARVRTLLSFAQVRKVDELLNPEGDTLLDRIALADEKHLDSLKARDEEKEAQERAQQTCTCTWTSSEIRIVNPECPIHKDEGDATVITTTEVSDD